MDDLEPFADLTIHELEQVVDDLHNIALGQLRPDLVRIVEAHRRLSNLLAYLREPF